MSADIYYEVQLLAASLAVGIWLMAAYDGLRLFRLSVRHGAVWTGIEDGCYWICSGIVTFVLLLNQNDGVLRGYAIVGVLAGMLLYNEVVSRKIFILLKKCKKYLTIKKQKHVKSTKRSKRRCGKPEECEKRKKKT